MKYFIYNIIIIYNVYNIKIIVSRISIVSNVIIVCKFFVYVNIVSLKRL